MDSMSTYARARASKRGAIYVFDWDKAARLIKEHKPQEAVAGIALHMECTAGTIYRDGQPIGDEYTYLASNWAIPVLVINGQEHECWVEKSVTEWDESTKWPKSALDILAAS